MSRQIDRAAGVLLGLAAGDALGAGYEFGPAVTGPVGMFGGGPFGWEPGEWTDDTQMAICIAEQNATGQLDLAAVGDRFIAWAHEATDVGVQTRAVLSAAGSGIDLPAVAADRYRRHPSNSAGNGSLMRTGPVALPFLDDRDRIADAAAEVSALTHADPLAIDACVLWTLAVGAAVETGMIPDVRDGLDHLAANRRDRWADTIDAAEAGQPGDFKDNNGFVVTALQAAWSSIHHTPVPEDQRARHLRASLETAVRIGRDTDTVAAIAGTLLGAAYGASAVPLEYKAVLHGWPGYTARDLVRLGIESRTSGPPDQNQWPSIDDFVPYYEENFPHDPVAAPLPDDPGVKIGNVGGIRRADTDVIVSLCRMGAVPLGSEHHDVWLLDEPDRESNPHLQFVLDDTVDFIAARRDAGEMVFVHCVRAESRTPTVAALYLAQRQGIPGTEALERIRTVLPDANPNAAFTTYLESIEHHTPPP